MDDKVFWLQNSVHRAFDQTNPEHPRTKTASHPSREVMTNLKGKLEALS